MLPGADQLYNRKELLMSIVLLLFFEHQHEVMTKTRLHHDPIHGSREINVSCQKNYVFTWRRLQEKQCVKSYSQNTCKWQKLIPCKVVMLLWLIIRCGITCSNDPCHLQDAPGQGQLYGRNSHASSWSAFSVCTSETVQPLVEYLQGNITLLATFSIAKLRILPVLTHWLISTIPTVSITIK